MVFLIGLIATAIITRRVSISDNLVRALIYVSCAGGIGGIIYSMKCFRQYMGEGTFDLNETWWYILGPFISIILGAVSYLLILGGLLSIGNAGKVNYNEGIMLYSAVAFLAGFSSQRFTNKLSEIARVLFTERKDKIIEEENKAKNTQNNKKDKKARKKKTKKK